MELTSGLISQHKGFVTSKQKIPAEHLTLGLYLETVNVEEIKQRFKPIEAKEKHDYNIWIMWQHL